MPFFSASLDGRYRIFTLITASAIAVIAGRTAYRLYNTSKHSGLLIYKAPRATQADDPPDEPVPYPSDALPASRDVQTPYGTIRVNEWGPEDGRKVLFVHGISTPSLACAHMAIQLAKEDGCRVMMFDLFGRGYSDTPDPTDLKQDIRLFTTQILLVLTSSAIPWTGHGNEFTLVGYSLGGGIAASFTSYFPHLVETLVLIAPAGLMRASRIQLSSRLIYGGFLPDLLRDHLVRRRIAGPPSNETPKKAVKTLRNSPAQPDKDDNPEFAPGSTAPLFPNSVASAAETVVWQLKHNPGFLPAFISSIRYAPISNEHDRWRIIGSRLNAQRREPSENTRAQGLREGKVLLIFGKDDSVVVPAEVIEDATEVLGEDNVHVDVLEGGHDVVITNSQGCVESVRQFWHSASIQTG